MKKKQLETLIYSVIGIAAMFFIVVAVNVIGSIAKSRVDMTQEQLYTLSDGTKQILKKLDGVVEIRFYCTEGEKEMPLALKSYAQRVEDLLGEYKQQGKGNIELKKLNPKPDSDEEDAAQLDGVEGQMLPSGEKLYLGLAVSYLDAKASLPFLAPDREKLLEYDLSRAITRVFSTDKPVVGVMTPLPMFGMPVNPMMMRMGQQGQEPWVVISELKRDFNVKEVPMDTDHIDHDVKLLVVAHPRDISEKAQYAIDQFLMRGGKLIAFLDSQSLMDTRNQQQNPMMPNMGGGSNLDKLLKAWGLQFDTTKVVADSKFVTRIVRNNRQEAIPAVLSLTAEGINKDDIATGQIDTMLLPFSGVFTGAPTEGLKQSVLLKTTPDSQLVEGFMAQMGGEQIMKDFKASGTAYALAVRLQGKFKSAFPEGKPKEVKDEKDEDKKDEKKEEAKPEETLKESQGETAVILLGDADLLADNFSVQVQNIFGQRIVVPRNGNLTFVQNVVEQMSGDINLIKMRSRATLNRPFTVVQDMQARAEDRFRTKIKEIETSLQETQQKLNELQSKKETGQRFILSPEQQAELTKFRAKEAQAKKDLKEVRKELRQEIDSLENRLKWANIAGMPLVVVIFGLALVLFKRQRAQAR